MSKRIQRQIGPFPGDFMSLESLQTFLVPFEWKNLKFRIKKHKKHIRSNVLNSSVNHLLIVLEQNLASMEPAKTAIGRDVLWDIPGNHLVPSPCQ